MSEPPESKVRFNRSRLAQRMADARRAGWAEWVRSENDEAAVMEGAKFDRSAGEYVVNFLERFTVHTMGEWAGKPFILLPWERDDLILPLFGWLREDGTRRYRNADIFIAKKNGKSTLLGSLVPYFLRADGEQRAEIYGAAYTRQQAGIVYREAAEFCRKSPQLSQHFDCIDSQKRIVCRRTSSFYQSLAAEAEGSEGPNAYVVMFDEIHVQKNDRLYKALRYAMAARRNGMMLNASTVGVEERTTIWWARYTYAKGIMAGDIIDPASFGLVYQADEDCAGDVEKAGDPAQWRKANPSLGSALREEEFRDAYTEARNSPVMFNAFLRYRLNVPTKQEARMIPMDDWALCNAPLPDLMGRRCFGGLDIADTSDLTALVLWFPRIEGEDRDWLLPVFWTPEEVIAKRIAGGFGFYDVWRRDELIRITKGKRIDHHTITADIIEMAKQYHIEGIAYDDWNAADVAQDLEAEGLPCHKVAQTMSQLAFGTKCLMTAIGDHTFSHGDNQVLNWMAGNAAGIPDHNTNMRPAKDKSADKIDGIVAAVMAVGLAELRDEEPGPEIIIV